MPPDVPAPLSLEMLFGLFGDTTWPRSIPVAAREVPQPYHRLLVHHEHMTVAMEVFYQGPVSLQVLARRHSGSWYARKILLLRENRVVQFGIMRIHLHLCSPEVRAAVLREDTPLGHILVRHNVLRYIEPLEFLRIVPDAALCQWFGLAQPRETYGRTAIIHCAHQPAIELLEIPAPVPTDKH